MISRKRACLCSGPSGARAARAVMAVAALAAVPWALGFACDAAPRMLAGEFAEETGFIDAARRALASSGSPSLAAFESELFSLASYDEVRATKDGAIVGFTAKGDARTVFGAVASELRSAGWKVVPSGSGMAGSFVKDGGTFVWAFVSCSVADDATSVVVSTVRASGRSA